MTNLFPGAEWRPMPGQEKRPARRKGRGVGFHVAVYTGPSIYDINLRTGNDAHLYVRLDGSCEQNVDLDLQAWAGADGNPSMIWVETAGGVDQKTVNTELWTPAQAATLARIARYAHDTESTPLQVMPDSKPTSRGVGTHRLGITHSRGIGAVPGFRVAGGESWSNVIGKECPGDAKVAQVPDIVTAAISGGDDMANVPQDQWDAVYQELTKGRASRALDADGKQSTWTGRALDYAVSADAYSLRAAQEATAARQEIAGLRVAVDKLAAALAAGDNDLTAEELQAAIETAMAKVVKVEVSIGEPPTADAPS